MGEENSGFSFQGNSITLKSKFGDTLAEPANAANEPAVWSIFLGSTIKDLDGYRRQVEDALRTRASTACFLSEDWNGSYQNVEQLCRDRLNRAHGYIGIFGFYYGWKPADSARSITHSEFLWAKQKWQGKRPPIAVLMPKTPSAAERHLKKEAENHISQNAVERKEHERLLKTFHDEVQNSGMMVMLFKNRQELRERVIVQCLEWRNFRPMDAATNKVQVIENNDFARNVTDEELGLLGRKKHFEKLERMLSQIKRYSAVPAIAVVVSGNEDAGQRLFTRSVVRAKPLRSGRPPQIGRPQLDQYNLSSLIQCAGEMLGAPKGREIRDLTELAELVHAELQDHQLCLVLDEINRYHGGVAKFHENFWQPFFTKLAELQAQKPALHRLIFLLVDYTGRSDSWEPAAIEYDEQPSETIYSKLLLLPRLTPFTSDDMFDWFTEVEIEEKLPGRLNKLANAVLTNAADEADGTPLRVYERLRKENLWDE